MLLFEIIRFIIYLEDLLPSFAISPPAGAKILDAPGGFQIAQPEPNHVRANGDVAKPVIVK